MSDPLSDTLQALRLRGTVYFRADFAAPWGMDFRSSELANFHFVVHGQCWVDGPVGDELRLGRGDVVVFPHGDAHRVASAPDADIVPARELIESTGRERAGRTVYGGTGETATLLCGHFELERSGGHPLLAALPRRIQLGGEEGGVSCIAAASELAVAESERGGAGSAVLVDRLAEILLIEIIRGYAASTSDEAGFLAALDNEAIARALAEIHAEPAREWSVEALAHVAAMSRSSFSALFSRLVGIAPMRYLTVWRMHRARELLLATAEPIAGIAGQVGYESEFAFARAYKRVLGEAPGSTRRRRAG